MWRREWLSDYRVDEVPAMSRIVVAIDPPLYREQPSGFVVAGYGLNKAACIIREEMTDGDCVDHIKRAAEVSYAVGADAIVIEHSQAAGQLQALTRQISDKPVAIARTKGGRWLRAEPVAALYAEGRVKNLRQLERLEFEMCELAMQPSRCEWRVIDAMLAAVHHLMLVPTNINIRAL